MKLGGSLIVLFMTLSAAQGLRCFSCIMSKPQSCTDTISCPALLNRCFTLKVEGDGLVNKGCQNSVLCVGPMSCCEGDLCNAATHTGPSVILLLGPLAIITLLF
ncbi:lymphocyte antigen 6G-like [Thalassophryne amazonica]|uniref:lymphocyte antigen 6G-like n=1 Tax=Thalassophryne amazonica TaxID=390379 RepID=UPI0014716F95|nr:lymphocyte antigen 6G-like [Thalassophryne amazonica]